MWRPSSASSRSPTARAQPSLPSARASWTARAAPPGVPASWLRWLHVPLAAAGLAWVEPAAWPRYLTVVGVLALEWPFCIQLTEGVEVYMPVMWTSAAAAYLLGPADPARVLGGGDPRLRAHRAPRRRGRRARGRARGGIRPPLARPVVRARQRRGRRHPPLLQHGRARGARGDDRRLRRGMHLSIARHRGRRGRDRRRRAVSRADLRPHGAGARVDAHRGSARTGHARGDAPAAPGDGVVPRAGVRSTAGRPASRPPACPRSRCTRS